MGRSAKEGCRPNQAVDGGGKIRASRRTTGDDRSAPPEYVTQGMAWARSRAGRGGTDAGPQHAGPSDFGNEPAPDRSARNKQIGENIAKGRKKRREAEQKKAEEDAAKKRRERDRQTARKTQGPM